MSSFAKIRLGHPAVITLWVLLLHAGALWALQSGLLARAVEVVVPAALIAELIQPPVPEPPQQAQAPKQEPLKAEPLPKPAPRRVVREQSAEVTPQIKAAEAPLAITKTDERAAEPSALSDNKPSAPAAAPPAPAAVLAVARPEPKLELPRSDADYLNNPAPAYPPISRRSGEQGRVMLRVRVSALGGVELVELSSSSGAERLDAAALAAVQRWRFRPGTRGGVAEAMWVKVPIDFKLD